MLGREISTKQNGPPCNLPRLLRPMAYPVLLNMPKRPRYARIAITLPAPDLAAADRIAREQDRPRSWIIAEAVRQYAQAQASARDSLAPTPPAEAAGLGSSRRAQLVADLRLTAEQRVRAAEQTARAATRPRRTGVRRVIVFDRYEDYLNWKRVESALG